MSAQSSPPPQAGPSGTLYAQATKTWVLPPRPKPGRKPKKDAVREDDDEATEEQARKSQNRASQRAFRERRQDQLATLQARLQQYEQGETERYVQLQAIGKRLKDENDQLRLENARLQEEAAMLRAERAAHCKGFGASSEDVEATRMSRKRLSSMGSDAASSTTSRKRAKSSAVRLGLDATCPAIDPALGGPTSPLHWTSPRDSVFTPSSTTGATPSSHGMPSPMVVDRIPSVKSLDKAVATTSTGGSSLHTLPAIDDYLARRPSRDMQITNCGFCSDDTPCICREIARQGAREEDIHALTQTFGSGPSSSSILDNLPPYQPPVPLRKRTARSSKAFIFPIVNQQGLSALPREAASCSGDPNNCDACRDDSFGQALCTAISAMGPKCGPNCACKRPIITLPRLETMQPVDGCAPMGPPTIIPRNFAWRTLKAHPAIQQKSFNNLDLLAEVVVGGSHHASPSPMEESDQHQCSTNKDTMGSGCGKEGCNFRANLEVPMEGVRDALAILDRHLAGRAED